MIEDTITIHSAAKAKGRKAQPKGQPQEPVLVIRREVARVIIDKANEEFVTLLTRLARR